ncbi:MAG: hypothetical protein BJ554DRAFT_3528 [Olpidium bornovanus]|uniref:V-type proton ATPase subunit G n=1 Tax=Olpidium bornovanus TaxID=278681 RepID=A0A8H8DFV9_9FUNG|nr:MAG: hypothetical protein BJ554DRAFT_3528 [Olpidium bornovanus]
MEKAEPASVPIFPDRIQRLKDARTEAQKEIEQLKAQKLAEFQDFEKQGRLHIPCFIPDVFFRAFDQHAGSSDQVNQKVNADTDKELVQINEAFAAKKQSVIDRLMATVVTCEPKAHVNAKPGVRV